MAAVTKAPPYKKYTDSKFREIIPQLPLPEYLKIEYLSKGVWFKMLSKRVNSYNCECCGVDNVGPKPITEHVRGKKHRFALQAAEKLYHPNYTAPKNSTVPARTPILDAYNSAAGVSGTAAKQAKAVPAPKAGAESQKLAAITQKPAGTSQKPAAGAQKTVAQTPKPTDKVQKTVELAQKDVGQQKPATGPQQKPQLKLAAGRKPNESVQTAATASKTNAPAIKVAEKALAPIQVNETVPVKEGDTAKQPENIKTEQQPKDTEIEIVVLDDDDDTTVPKKESASVAEGQTAATNTAEAAKPQRATKRIAITAPIQQNSAQDTAKPLVTDSKQVNATIPQSKRVINPAAILSKSAEKNSENKPRYQQNRVIIPTVDKTKKKPSPVVHKQSTEDTPSFSTKGLNMTNEPEGIIGVEYVVKILKVYNDPEPFYECCLCEVVMDGIGMQTHLLGYNHRYKYMEKHFPTCFNQYKDHFGNIQVMGIVLDRISKAIEAHHGRELPYECLSGEFRSNRHGVMTTVYSFRHASEYSGPSFTNVVDNKQIDELYKKKQMYLPPKPDPKRKPTFDTRIGAPETKRSKLDRRGILARGGSRGSNGNSRRPYREELETNVMDDAVHKQMVEEFLQNTRGRSRSPTGGRRRRHRSRSRSRSRSPHRSSRRKEPPRRSLSPLREGDVWQAYRHLVDRLKTEVDAMYRDYRKDPEKHPLYNEEWRKFWKHRKEQMAREGLDHKNYDFQPEWVRYFAVRIEELYDEAVEDIKVNCRRRLILPMTNDEVEDKRYHVKEQFDEELPLPKVAPTPQYVKTDDKTSVVSVLRLLTALEDYLGSLGPRVVDLLSQALLVEKSNPREINEIVLTIENCTVLETAMEKLKGVLIAGLLEGPKVRAFNNVIQETEKILKIAYKIKQRNPQPVPQPVPAPKSQLDFQKSSWSAGGGGFMPSPQPNSIGVGVASSGSAAGLLSQIDKKELATKLAAALTAQGKTDFNPEQLQQLIAVYSLIDKKKRDSAAVADKQKMTLSDTLTALLNPSEKSSVPISRIQQQQSGHTGSGGNYSNSNADRVVERPGPVTNSSINSFVSMMNRDNSSTGGSGADSQMWQNLQNIQTSLRTQNALGTSSNSGGFGNSSMGFRNNADNMSSGGDFNRGGFGGRSTSGGGGSGFSLGQNSSMNFNRNGPSGLDSGGFTSNFSNISSNNTGGFSRGGVGGGGGSENMLSSVRGRGGLGGNFSNGGMGSGNNNNNNFSRSGGGSGMGLGIGTGGGTGGGNHLSRGGVDNFLGGESGSTSNTTGGYGGNFSSTVGLNNYSKGGAANNNNYQRNSAGLGNGNSGLGLGLGNSGAGSSFARGGTNTMNNNSFNNQMNNKNTGRNDGGGPSFGSNQRMDGLGAGMGFGSNQRGMGANQQNRGNSNMLMGSNANNNQGQGGNRGGGSNWRNQ